MGRLFLIIPYVFLAGGFLFAVEFNSPKKVFLDPGHGGRDAGTYGYGALEKEIVLQLAKKIRTVLLVNFPEEVEVILSRNNDRFLSLRDRVKQANDWGADLFLSLHANFSPHTRPHGFEVYFYGDKASDASANRTALKENSVNKVSVKKVDRFLHELKKSAIVEESSNFSELMFSSLSPHFQRNGKGVKQAPFFVLQGSDMPSALIEVGYLSNDEDARALQKENYLNAMANAISKGIQKFLKLERRQVTFPNALAAKEKGPREG